jgi:hypothetical protein
MIPETFCAVPEWQVVQDFVSPGEPVRMEGAPELFAVNDDSEKMAEPVMNAAMDIVTKSERKFLFIR